MGASASHSLIWATIQRFAGVAIQFVAGIVLARLLSPADYGVIGMLSIFMSVGYVFIDGGFGSAIIQKDNPTEADYSTVFYWNIFIAVVIYAILYLSAPYIAVFYNTPILKDVLRVQGTILIINALYTIQFNLLQKRMKFRRIAFISLISALISFITTICLAYRGWGVWALVAQNLLLTLIPGIIYVVFSEWRPRFVFSFASLKSLSSFSVYVLITNLINNIGNSMESMLVGRFYNASVTGLYTKAKSTQGIATTSLSEAVRQVTLPLYSARQNDRAQLIGLVGQLSEIIIFITAPMAFLLIIIAHPLFVILYSTKWVGSILFFQILCLAGIATSLGSVNTHAVTAIGNSRAVMNVTIFNRVMGLLIIFGGMLIWGIKGLVIGVVVQSWLGYFLNAALISRHLDYGFIAQIKKILPILLMAVGAYCVAVFVGYILKTDMYVEAVASSLVYLIVFIATSHFLRVTAYIYIKDRLRFKICKSKH